MVRSCHRVKEVLISGIALAMPILLISPTHAATQANVDFNINVAEILTVTVKNPATWASGNINTLLRNKVNVAATTNSPIGVTVSMYTGANTELRNTTAFNSSDVSTYIPTLNSVTTAASFPDNYWGYSFDDNASGSPSANYAALKTSADPIQVFTTVGTANIGGNNKDVYFGAKADDTKQAGTYMQTVYFAAVTGTIDTDNPAVPVDPPHQNPDNGVAHYDSTPNSTTYTTRTTSGSGTSSVSGATNDTTTEIITGDVTSYYAHAAGVENSTNPASTTTSTDSTVPVLIGAAAGIATVSGVSLYAFSRRRQE